MIYSDIKASVVELLDGRTFTSYYDRWIKRVRDKVALNPMVGGFRGLYFLYKEATVEGGSVVDQSQYEIPDDFIDNLNVFYDGTLLVKAPSAVLDFVKDVTDPDSGTPQWYQMKGKYFEILPPADTAGDEIKLLYNAMPDDITSDGQEDYFTQHFPDLHIYGMAELGARYLGGSGGQQLAQAYKQEFVEQQKILQLHNRRHHLQNARLRFHNWDEYEEQKKYLFPQYQEV